MNWIWEHYNKLECFNEFVEISEDEHVGKKKWRNASEKNINREESNFESTST